MLRVSAVQRAETFCTASTEVGCTQPLKVGDSATLPPSPHSTPPVTPKGPKGSAAVGFLASCWRCWGYFWGILTAIFTAVTYCFCPTPLPKDPDYLRRVSERLKGF